MARALPFLLLLAAALPARAALSAAAEAVTPALASGSAPASASAPEPVPAPSVAATSAAGSAPAAAAASTCAAPTVSREAVLAQVTAMLQAAAPRPFERVELEPVGSLPTGLPTPALALKSAWPAARVAVELRWDACGVSERKLVWFKARAWRQAWVYGRAAARDVALAEAQPAPGLVDMAQWRLPDSELAAAPAGEYLVRPVQAGAPLRRADLKPAPLVKRNDRITVLVQGKGVQLRAAALALQFGAAEEWIAVMVDGAEKSIRARVVAPGVVHVDI